LGDNIDVEAEKEKLQKEMDYTKGFLKIVEEKLSNEKFVQNAPQQLVENEQNKLADAKKKIKILTEKLSAISNG
jgi:valyl-tRNA synthetase